MSSFRIEVPGESAVTPNICTDRATANKIEGGVR